MMTTILIKALCIQVLFLGVYRFILVRYTSFTFNRYFLLTGLLCMVVLPWVEIVIPEYVAIASIIDPMLEEGITLVDDKSQGIEYTSLLGYGFLLTGMIILLIKSSYILRYGKKFLRYPTLLRKFQRTTIIVSLPKKEWKNILVFPTI